MYIYTHTRCTYKGRERGWTLTVGDGGGGGGVEDEYYSRKLFAFSDAIYPRLCV